MKDALLHSGRLEKLVGPVRCEVVRQNGAMRMVHLRDSDNISRTLGLVQFHAFEDVALQRVHEKILAGSILGRTLQESGIDFRKEVENSFELPVPAWLQQAFGSKAPSALAICSAIYVRPGNAKEYHLHYADILEIIPGELQGHFAGSGISGQEVREVFHTLCRFAGLNREQQNVKAMKRSIVIGAGPGGLVAAKELLENGSCSVICLEQSGEVGGIFARGYDNLILTSSVTFSMFSDYWVGDGKDHHFWSKEEAVAYWAGYAEHYRVLEHIRFHTKVHSVTDVEGRLWRVALQSGEVLECEHLVLAIGNNNIPRYPEWSSLLTGIPYAHSRDYKNAEPFRDKRVLIVGGGESGSDVAYEISKVAAGSWVSLRESTGWIVPRRRGAHAADVSTHRGIWDLPREYGKILSPYVLKLERARKDPVFDVLAELNEKVRAERGIWGIFGTKTLALPKAIAYHGCKVVGDITKVEEGGRRLQASCGQVLEDVDTVVFCTGYKNQVAFLPEGLQQCDPRQMFKHMFHPAYRERIAWIGWARPGFGSQFPIMEMQARYAAQIFSGTLALPEGEHMKQLIENDYRMYKEQFEDTADRIRSLVDYHRFMNGMAKLLGCYPPLWKYFFLRPGLWIHLMYGPTQATQFRLRGPGKKVKLAHDILRKLPVSTFNHIVKAGLRGRVLYGIRALKPGLSRARA